MFVSIECIIMNIGGCVYFIFAGFFESLNHPILEEDKENETVNCTIDSSKLSAF